MSAYVAKISFSAIDEHGAPITVPIGARVEYGDHYYNSYPEAFEPEDERKFFGRINPGSGQVETTVAADPPETRKETPEPPAPEPEPAPEPKTSGSGPKSSVGRRTLPKQ